MSSIDLEQLKIEIQGLNRHKQLYKVLKEELSKRGWWKNKPRGNPKKAYQISRGNKKER